MLILVYADVKPYPRVRISTLFSCGHPGSDPPPDPPVAGTSGTEHFPQPSPNFGHPASDMTLPESQLRAPGGSDP